MLVSKRGYDAVVVYNGADAVNIVGEKEFDVIILDMKMPGMDGVTTLKVISDMGIITQVIILSGHMDIDCVSDY